MFRFLCLLGFHTKRPEAFFTCNPHDRDIVCVRCYTKKEKWGKEAEGASFLTTPVPESDEPTIGGLNLEEWKYIAKVVWTWPGIDPKLTRQSQVILSVVNENVLILGMKKEYRDEGK